MEKSIGQVFKEMNYQSQSTQVSDIELSQEEINEALAGAKEKKSRIVEHNRREDIRRKLEEFYMSKWETGVFRDFIRQRMISTGFTSDDGNRNILNALSCYFNNDKEFENFQLNNINQKMDLKKGLFIFGTVGVGKTRIMELFRINKRQCYQAISCRKVVSEYVKHGVDVIEPFSKSSYPFVKSMDNFWQTTMGVCFDDLGTESESANNYGNRKNVFEQIILDRYDNHLPFDQTHFTSNLSPEMIKERYGERVSSRLREMMNLIELQGTDRRI